MFFEEKLLGGNWFDGEWHFLTQSLEDGDHHFVASLEFRFDFLEELWVVVAVEIVSHITIVVHKGKVTLLGDIDQVVLDSGHVWYHVVGGGGHINDLAWVSLEHSIAVLSEGTALDWVSEGTSGTGSFEGFVVRHLAKYF